MAKKLVAESGSQLLARLSSRPSLAQLDCTLFPEELQPGDIVQISGGSGTGKSLLLLQLLTKCLLPKTYRNLVVGGLGVGVILIDTDHNISILKLAELMEQFILNSYPSDNIDSVVFKKQVSNYVEDILNESMNRLFLLKTYSSMQLQMNFNSLVKLLSTNCNISLLMIDSLTSYYWEDTMNVKNYKKMDLYLKVMIEKLQKCVQDFKIVTIYVKQEYFQSKHADTKLPQVKHKIDLKKNDKANGLFYACIESVQSCCPYSISDKGIIWIVH